MDSGRLRQMFQPDIRDAVDADMRAVHRIYTPYVQHSLATFEETPPSLETLRERYTAVRALGLPYLVAEIEGQVVGYSYAGAYRSRSAYRYTVENSMYIAEGFTGSGIGTLLLKALIGRCEAGPWRQMVAVIGNSANAASIALHRRFGFREVGTLTSVGFKKGKWVDTVLMQRALGMGDTMLPELRIQQSP